MAELKTRISLKYDTLANWQKSTLKLNKGELAIAVIPTADPANKQLPPVMFKVGDGEHTFAELGNNWSSALAADVYSWAKAASRPAYKYGDADLTGFGTAAAKNVGDFDKAGAAATAETNAKAYVDEKIGAIPAQAEYTLEMGETDGSLVLKKDGEVVGDPAIVKGWAELLAKAQKGIDDAATAQAAAEAAQAAATKAQGDIDAYKTSNDKALAAVKATADAAQTSAQVDAKISAHNTSTEAHADIRGEITALSEKVSGRATNYVYKNKTDTAYTTAIGKAGSFIVGDTIYFTDANISDQWVIKVNATAPYYEFQDIETEKPSFDGYVKGTGLTADKLVLGNAGSNVKASTYGVSGTLTATDEANLPTSKAVATYVGGQLGNLQADEVTATVAQTISSIKQVDGKITIGAAQDIKIAQSQVTGLDTALGGKQDNLSADQLAAVNSGITKTKVGTYDGYATGKQDKLNADQLAAVNSGITAAKVGTYDGYATGKQDALSDDQLAAVNSGITAAKVGQYDGYATGKQDTLSATNKLSADFISGLGAAAKKGVDATVSATSENLPTSKAVASYVSGEIDKISIPTVNNAALKDASGATIFTANASADVQILVIDCGNASGWEA